MQGSCTEQTGGGASASPDSGRRLQGGHRPALFLVCWVYLLAATLCSACRIRMGRYSETGTFIEQAADAVLLR